MSRVRVFDRLTVDWPVRVDLGDGNGAELSEPIGFRFEILPNDEYVALVARGGMAEVLRRAVRGWREDQVEGEDGQPLAFGPENLNKLLLMPRVNAAIVAAYFDAARGERRKNYAPPRDGG
jgi:hypothetical protein